MVLVKKKKKKKKVMTTFDVKETFQLTSDNNNRRGWNRSVGSVFSSLSCVMQCRGFKPSLSLW